MDGERYWIKENSTSAPATALAQQTVPTMHKIDNIDEFSQQITVHNH